MKVFRYLALCFVVGSYSFPIEADMNVPAVSIEEAIKKGQALMASHYAKMPELQCFVSKAEYKLTPVQHWSIVWSGKNPASCFAEVRVSNEGKAMFVVGY